VSSYPGEWIEPTKISFPDELDDYLDNYDDVVSRLSHEPMSSEEAERTVLRMHEVKGAVGDIHPGEGVKLNGWFTAGDLEALSIVMRAARVEAGTL
jgi:hypothetical protein